MVTVQGSLPVPPHVGGQAEENRKGKQGDDLFRHHYRPGSAMIPGVFGSVISGLENLSTHHISW